MQDDSESSDKGKSSGEEEAALELPQDSEELEEAELLDPQAKKIRQIVRRTIVETSGPLPQPSILREYDEILPGLADRIVSMAESEQKHRHRIDEVDSRMPFEIAKRGQRYGMTSVILVISLSAILVFLGHPTAAVGLASAVLVALAAVFVTGQFSSRKKEGSEAADDEELDK
ncbi:DUF2335 domain-containing protein [Nocardiopsis sp. YSL2]|uniref:DUF2335 domain-containing protein n=1 Tax=Nocardiopsis sp. YSL2 TaxID=2939492 RepID=UPI0026F429CA|nr:DUF2335 domain-containing protein [Nocardiopsis sp. YSL2]